MSAAMAAVDKGIRSSASSTLRTAAMAGEETRRPNMAMAVREAMASMERMVDQADRAALVVREAREETAATPEERAYFLPFPSRSPEQKRSPALHKPAPQGAAVSLVSAEPAVQLVPREPAAPLASAELDRPTASQVCIPGWPERPAVTVAPG